MRKAGRATASAMGKARTGDLKTSRCHQGESYWGMTETWRQGRERVRGGVAGVRAILDQSWGPRGPCSATAPSPEAAISTSETNPHSMSTLPSREHTAHAPAPQSPRGDTARCPLTYALGMDLITSRPMKPRLCPRLACADPQPGFAPMAARLSQTHGPREWLTVLCW